MRTMATYQLETTEPAHIYLCKSVQCGLNPDFKYTDIDDEIAEFITGIYNPGRTIYDWDKIIL